MSGFGTHKRFTSEMGFPSDLCSAYTKENKHFKKDTEYDCRKIILGALGVKWSFQKGCYKLHKAARFTCTCITRLSTFWTCNSELNFSSTPLSLNPQAHAQPYVKLKIWLSDACGRETLVPVLSDAGMQTVEEKNSSFLGSLFSNVHN